MRNICLVFVENISFYLSISSFIVYHILKSFSEEKKENNRILSKAERPRLLDYDDVRVSHSLSNLLIQLTYHFARYLEFLCGTLEIRN